MAFVDFYQQSTLFNLPPHDPNLHYGFLKRSTTRLVADGDPANDLEDKSVFVDIEVFIKSVLHAPVDWKTQWAPVIHMVKRNPDFMKHYLEHRVLHKKKYAEPEESHYEPLLLMNDATLRVAFPATLSQDTPLPLTQLVLIVDDGIPGCVLNEGSSIPQLVAKEEHPPSNHMRSTDSLRSTPENALKRKRDSDFSPECKKRRLDVTSAPGRVNLEIDEIDWETLSSPEPQDQPGQPIEVGRRLMELLSIRPHVTVGLVDRNRIQFYHANHSVVLVSSAINLSLEDDEGSIDKLIAILIAFRRLFLNDRRIMEPIENATILRLEGNEKLGGPIEIELGAAISLSPSLVGRSTAVIYGRSGRWPKSRVVVKISWVDETLISEEEFMDKAVEEATKSGHEWAVNHLPRFLYVEDVKDATDRAVQELLKIATFANKKYTYKRRQMRIVIQEPLHPLKSLASARDVGQVILDVACVHRWLYDHAGILHGDLSPGNIMYRIIEDQIHGVLTDYDLACWKAALTTDGAKTSQQVTGTTPYMAQELLKGTSPVHLYRHDVESLFYVMLVICGRHTIRRTRVGTGSENTLRIVIRSGKLPYQDWFEERDYVVGLLKGSFFFDWKDIELSSSFEGFRMWLESLQWLFRRGFALKRGYGGVGVRSCTDELAPFDDETLGGCIDYSTLIELTRRLTGDLEGLVVRYDPLPYPLRTLPNPILPSD